MQVLTMGYWPAFPPVEILPPPEFKAALASFEQFYTGKTQHRKLAWAPSQGSATMRAVYGRVTYEFGVHTLQAIVLLHFNATGAATVPLEALQAALRVEPDVLKRIMHSLSCGKYKVRLGRTCRTPRPRPARSLQRRVVTRIVQHHQSRCLTCARTSRPCTTLHSSHLAS